MRYLLFLFFISSLTHAAPAIEVVSRSLDRPWGMAEVAPGKLLISQKGGSFVLFDTTTRGLAPVAGAPAVFTDGQGGITGCRCAR